tara:strand:- start:264 stop:419 length:156 start_codon:yes stop_codon:yes gene_type:complete
MAYKQSGWLPFTKTDDKKKLRKIPGKKVGETPKMRKTPGKVVGSTNIKNEK